MITFQKKDKTLLVNTVIKGSFGIWPLRKKNHGHQQQESKREKYGPLISTSFKYQSLWNQEHIRMRWYRRVPVTCVQ